MKKPIGENILIVAMLFFFCAGLAVKGMVGSEEHRSVTLQVLLYSAPIGLLFLLFRRLDEHLAAGPKKILPVLAQTWLRRYDPVLLLMLCCIALADLVPILSLKNLVDDETEFFNAIQILVDRGSNYFFTHYSEVTWLGPQHPPLPVLIIGYIVKFLGVEVYYPARITAMLLGLGTAVCTYLIARQLYNRRIARWAVVLLLAVRYMTLAQVTSNNDIFVTFFFTLTVLFVLRLKAVDRQALSVRVGWALAAGLAIGLGLLSKYTMALVYLMLLPLVYWPFAGGGKKDHFFRRLWTGLKANTGLVLVVVLTSVAVFYLWLGYMIKSGLINLHAAQLMYYLGADVDPYGDWQPKVIENGYFSAWRLKFFLQSVFYGIPSGIGTYLLPLVGIGVWVFIRQHKAGERVMSNGFIRYWLAIVFIPMLIALPVHRYFLPAFPALAIMLANGLDHFYEKPFRVLALALFLSYATLFVYMS
jgi:4-amino-4-deoxy-L-arabinose transferase-like glycosyltransferase